MEDAGVGAGDGNNSSAIAARLARSAAGARIASSVVV
jgi:hypothetical protein